MSARVGPEALPVFVLDESTPQSYTSFHGRLAQSAEYPPEKREVRGSNPLPATVPVALVG